MRTRGRRKASRSMTRKTRRGRGFRRTTRRKNRRRNKVTRKRRRTMRGGGGWGVRGLLFPDGRRVFYVIGNPNAPGRTDIRAILSICAPYVNKTRRDQVLNKIAAPDKRARARVPLLLTQDEKNNFNEILTKIGEEIEERGGFEERGGSEPSLVDQSRLVQLVAFLIVARLDPTNNQQIEAELASINAGLNQPINAARLKELIDIADGIRERCVAGHELKDKPIKRLRIALAQRESDQKTGRRGRTRQRHGYVIDRMKKALAAIQKQAEVESAAAIQKQAEVESAAAGVPGAAGAAGVAGVDVNDSGDDDDQLLALAH